MAKNKINEKGQGGPYQTIHQKHLLLKEVHLQNVLLLKQGINMTQIRQIRKT
jgi:hypothetical protein